MNTAGIMSGKIKVEVHNEHNELTHLEEKSNTIVAAAVQKLGAALCTYNYDWEGDRTSTSTIIALETLPENGATVQALCNTTLGGADITYNDTDESDWQSYGGILIKNSGGQTAWMGSSVPPSFNDTTDEITIAGSVTGVTTTWATAELGALAEYATAGNGTPTWCTKWADGDFTDTAVDDADTITITWTLTLNEVT